MVLFATCAFAFGGKPSKGELRKDLEEHSLVVFKNGEKTVSVVLDGANDLCISDNECYIPYEVINYPEFTVSVFGVKDNKRVTSARGRVAVIQSGYALGDEPQEPTSDEYSQLLNLANKYNADKVVDEIINRAGTDICPMEKKVRNIDDPKTAYEMFKEMFENFTPATFQ